MKTVHCGDVRRWRGAGVDHDERETRAGQRNQLFAILRRQDEDCGVDIVPACSTQGRAAAILTPESNRQWRLSSTSSVEDALGVIAADAISIIAGERDGKLALCASPTCQAAFFDTSQSRTRRWCEMNTCGNREKKERFNANNRKNSRSAK